MGRRPLQTLTDTKTFHDMWIDSEISTEEYIERETKLLLGLEDRVEPLNAIIKQEREYLKDAVREMGGKVDVPGLGRWGFTQPSEGHTYDKKLVDELVDRLDEMEYHDIAAALRACRKPSDRGSYFRFTKEK